MSGFQEMELHRARRENLVISSILLGFHNEAMYDFRLERHHSCIDRGTLNTVTKNCRRKLFVGENNRATS